ncbi:MAG: DEAD/DEAH box helicase family protein, partial [Candidatus Micrarchaeia archaeon]
EECLWKIKENERGLIKLPTGSGKGCIISATVAEKKVPTIVLVHRKDLLYQTVKRFKKEANIETGIIGDGKSEFKDVTVAMVQTLCRNLGIIDEWDEEDKTN